MVTEAGRALLQAADAAKVIADQHFNRAFPNGQTSTTDVVSAAVADAFRRFANELAGKATDHTKGPSDG